MPGAIEARELTKTYGDVTAVDGVSFAVAPGEIFAYLGRNGSGKTTTVRMLTTLTRPTSGSASVAGFDVGGDQVQLKRRIGVTMQDAALDPQMSGVEHLEFIAGIRGYAATDASNRSAELLELFGLTEAGQRASSTYSGGMRRRLDIATALLGEPEVLFLDEPTTGLDPQSRRAMWDEIRKLKARGATVFLTTQYIEEAEKLADHLAIIDRGKVISRGSVAEVKAEHGRRQISFRADDALAAKVGAATALEVTSADGRVTVLVPADEPDSGILRISSDLSAALGDLSGLEITDTSLEDVFLRLTGSSINDSAPVTEQAG